MILIRVHLFLYNPFDYGILRIESKLFYTKSFVTYNFIERYKDAILQIFHFESELLGYENVTLAAQGLILYKLEFNNIMHSERKSARR